MTDVTSAGETPPASVAIVAMGISNQDYLRRAYNGGSYDHAIHQTRQNIGTLVQDIERAKQALLNKWRPFGITPDDKARLDLIFGDFSKLGGIQSEAINALSEEIGKRYVDFVIGEKFEQTWCINHMGKLLKNVDLIIAMDDLRREKERYGEMLYGDVPILTSKAYPEFPSTIEYPIGDVVKDIGWVYFNNSVTYAVAYAIHLGVKRMALFGCDFHYDNRMAQRDGAMTPYQSEQARANCEFFLGIASARGIKVEIAAGSTTMDNDKQRPLYGYAEQPALPLNETHDLVWSEQHGWQPRPRGEAAAS